MELRSGTHCNHTGSVKNEPLTEFPAMDPNSMSSPKFKSIKELLNSREQSRRITRLKKRLLEEDEENEEASIYATNVLNDEDDDVTLMNMTLQEFWQSCKSKKKRKHNTMASFNEESDHSPLLVKQEPYEQDAFDLELPLISLMAMVPRRKKKPTIPSNSVTEITPKSSEHDKLGSASVPKESSTAMDGVDVGVLDVPEHNSFPVTHSDRIESSSVPIICVKNEDGLLCDDILCEYDKQEYYTCPFKVHSEVDNRSDDSNFNPLFSDSGCEGNMDFNGDLHNEDNFIRPFTPDYPYIHESWDTTNKVCLQEDDTVDGGGEESSSNKFLCNSRFEAQTDPHNHICTETLACTETFTSDTEIDPLGDHNNVSEDLESAIPNSYASELQESHVIPTGSECLSRTYLSPSCPSTSRDFFLHEFSKSFEEPAPLRDENELTISSYLVGDNWYPVHHYPEGLATFMPSEEKERLCEVMNNGMAETDDDLCRDMSQEKMHSMGTSDDNPLQIDLILDSNSSPKLLENGDGTTGEPVQMKKKMGGIHRKALKTPRPGRNPPRLNSISCTTIKGCSQHAVTFAQRQMHDIELLANKLTKELKHMKAVLKDRVQTDDPKISSPSYDTLARTAIRNATRVGETTQKWLSIMSRNCDRFCKIMRMSEIGTSALPSGAKKVRRITFADEVGGVLSHVRFFQDDTEPQTM